MVEAWGPGNGEKREVESLPWPVCLLSTLTTSSSWPHGAIQNQVPFNVKGLLSNLGLSTVLLSFILSISLLIKKREYAPMKIWKILKTANPDYLTVSKLPCRLDHLPSSKLHELVFPCVPVNNACVMVSAWKKGGNKEKREHTLLLQGFRSHISDVNAVIVFSFLKNILCLCRILSRELYTQFGSSYSIFSVWHPKAG